MNIGLRRGARRNGVAGGTDYATPEEFERLFDFQQASLLRLALLLTGSPEKAEKSLNHALRDCRLSSSVSMDWVLRWARRAIVRSAIQLVGLPDSAPPIKIMNGDSAGGNIQGMPAATSFHVDVSSVQTLPDLERLVIVMTILERMSIQDCALLLARSPKEVCDAQKRAIRLSAPAAHVPNASFKDGAAELDIYARLVEN